MKEFHLPAVSIIIPTYNRAHLIKESIQSVMDQTFTDWELIIIDDGSTDNTREVVSTLSDLRVRYLYNHHLSNIAAIRNLGLEAAVGEHIAFLDSDDLWLPRKLQSQLHLLSIHPEASFITNNINFFGERIEQSPPDYKNYFVDNLLEIALKEEEFGFYPSTLLFKRNAMNEVGRMDPSIEYACENHFYIRLCERFKGIFINERLVRIRKHNQNSSSEFPSQVLEESIKILRMVYGNGSITKAMFQSRLGHYYYKLGLEQLKQKEKNKSRQSFLTYIRLTPWHWKGWVRLLQTVGHQN